jgi:hypothetical protein
MEETISWAASGRQTRIYYLFVLLSLIYVLVKYRKQRLSILFILLFFNGLFAFYGKNLQNTYRIILVMFTLYWLYSSKAFIKINADFIVISFGVFTFTFLYTSYLNGDYFFIIFSQYSRYFILFALFLILKKYTQNVESFSLWLEKLVYDLLIIQIVLTIIKFLFVGLSESIVGSIASQGGAIATVLPIMGFVFIWLKKKGDFENRDWIFVLGLVFIGFVSLKRAIWFIMPVIIGLVMFYIPQKRIPFKVAFLSLVAVPLVFYIGVRLSPSLNKEGTLGGRFDLNYAFNYARNYMFGTSEDDQTSHGRGGATLLVYDKLVNGEVSDKDWLGHGLRFMFATDYGEFNELDLGIDSKGAASGFFQTMITNGYIGILSLVLFAFSLILKTKNKRLRFVLILIFCWEYFFYTGMILREPAISFLLIYIIVISPKYILVKKPDIISPNKNLSIE